MGGAIEVRRGKIDDTHYYHHVEVGEATGSEGTKGTGGYSSA